MLCSGLIRASVMACSLMETVFQLRWVNVTLTLAFEDLLYKQTGFSSCFSEFNWWKVGILLHVLGGFSRLLLLHGVFYCILLMCGTCRKWVVG